MAEENEEATSEEGGGSTGISMMVLLLCVVLALGAGAGAAMFLLPPHSGAPAGGGDMANEEPKEPVDPVEDFKARLVSLDPFVVNVEGSDYPRFLKIKVDLEADSPAAKAEIEARTPQIRDTTILLLSSRRVPDVTEFEGKALLKDDLQERINQLLEGGSVRSVFFTEFVVQ